MAIKPIKSIPAEKRLRPEYLKYITDFLASGNDTAEVTATGAQKYDALKMASGLRQTVARKFPGQVEVHRRGNRVFLQRGTPTDTAKKGGPADA